jgi:hypothetical protein
MMGGQVDLEVQEPFQVLQEDLAEAAVVVPVMH